MAPLPQTICMPKVLRVSWTRPWPLIFGLTCRQSCRPSSPDARDCPVLRQCYLHLCAQAPILGSQASDLGPPCPGPPVLPTNGTQHPFRKPNLACIRSVILPAALLASTGDLTAADATQAQAPAMHRAGPQGRRIFSSKAAAKLIIGSFALGEPLRYRPSPVHPQ